MKAHGISSKTALGGGESSKAATPAKATPAKGRASKKRKVEADNEDDDEAPATPVKKEAKVKRETRAKKPSKVKEEEEEVKEESGQSSEADDVIEGSFCLKDIPQAPPMSCQSGGDGDVGHASDDSDVCFVGSSSKTDRSPSHRQSMPPTPLPPSTHLDRIGAAFPPPLSRVQSFLCEANTPYRSQMRPTPSATMPTLTPTMMLSRRTTSDHPRPSAASPLSWGSQPTQQQSYFWNLNGNGTTSATGHGHHQP